MKIIYKATMVIVITIFVYWPGVPLVTLSCKQLSDDSLCFDIAKLQIHNPYSDYVWHDPHSVGKWSDMEKNKEAEFDYFVHENAYFFVAFVAVPVFAITGLIVRYRKTADK